MNIFTNIPSNHANPTVFKPLAVWLPDYVKKMEVRSFSTMFSTSFFKHMESCLMTTTFVTDCWSCVAAAADKPAASSCFVRVGDKRVLLREFVLELVLVLHSYNLRLVKVYNQ